MPAQEEAPAEDKAAETFRSRISALSAKVERSVALADGDTQADKDRSWIARRIINVFVLAISLVFLLLLLQGAFSHDWTPVGAQAVDLIKSAVLPVVTLVLGFYFGSRAGKG